MANNLPFLHVPCIFSYFAMCFFCYRSLSAFSSKVKHNHIPSKFLYCTHDILTLVLVWIYYASYLAILYPHVRTVFMAEEGCFFMCNRAAACGFWHHLRVPNFLLWHLYTQIADFSRHATSINI